MASPTSNKLAPSDLSKSAAPDSSKVVAQDSTKPGASDLSKSAEAAPVTGESSQGIGVGLSRVGKWLETSWLKVKPQVSLLVRFVYFLACYVALVIHGLCVFARGLVKFLDTRKKFSNPQVTTTETANGIISIIIGSFAIVVGSFGLVCTLVKNQILSIANLVVLFLSILGFGIFLLLYLKDTAAFVAEEKASTRQNMQLLYDISVIKASKQFTAAINQIQQKEKCCGWSGKDGENIFLNTPWYRKVNTNLSTQSQFLPKSCCIASESTCLGFKDLAEARKRKLVHATDCWAMISDKFNAQVNGVLVELIIILVIQTLCILPPVASFAWIGVQLVRSRIAPRATRPRS